MDKDFRGAEQMLEHYQQNTHQYYQDFRNRLAEDVQAILDEMLRYGELTQDEHEQKSYEWRQRFLEPDEAVVLDGLATAVKNQSMDADQAAECFDAYEAMRHRSELPHTPEQT